MPRWKPLVIRPVGIDLLLSGLKNVLPSGDIWVKGSRQFRDFQDYLLAPAKFGAIKRKHALPLTINPNSDQYLENRLQLRGKRLATVAELAKNNKFLDFETVPLAGKLYSEPPVLLLRAGATPLLQMRRFYRIPRFHIQ